MRLVNWRNKNVLITGGSGFLGSHLVRSLLEQNCNLTVLDNYARGLRYNSKSDSIRIVEGSVEDENAFRGIDNINYIFHFGSPSSIILYNQEPRKCFISTTIGCYNVLDFGKKQGVKKIVIPSSGSVYGEAPPPQSETTLPKPCNLYAVAKLTCEQMVKCIHEPPPTVFPRIFAGYGSNEDHKGSFASPVTLFLRAMMNNDSPIIYGNGNQTRDFVYVSDIVSIILQLVQSDFVGIVNVGTGLASSFNDVIQTINQRIKKNIEPKYVEKPPNYLERTLADTTLLKKLTGISPINLELGIDKYCEQLSL